MFGIKKDLERKRVEIMISGEIQLLEEKENIKDYIRLSECKKRRVYRLISRNLLFGVFDGDSRFIGIRKKFDRIFLDTEDHWGIGPPFGTARPEYDIGIDLPEDIDLRPTGNTVDKITGREISFDPPTEGGKGWFFKDTGESDTNISPIAYQNSTLFEFMKKIEKKYK